MHGHIIVKYYYYLLLFFSFQVHEMDTTANLDGTGQATIRSPMVMIYFWGLSTALDNNYRYVPDLRDVSKLTTIISYIYTHHTHQNTTSSHLNFGILFSLLCFDSNKFLAPVSIMALAQPSEEFHREIQTKRLRPTTVESIRSIKIYM